MKESGASGEYGHDRALRAPAPPGAGDMQATVVSDYDRTHVLNAILAYDLGARWRSGGRFVFYTGTPYWTNRAGNLPVPP